MSGPGQAELGSSVDVYVRGIADPGGDYLVIYDQPATDGCQATALDEENLPGASEGAEQQTPGGKFAGDVMVGLEGDPSSSSGAGQHRLCGYLLGQGADGGYDYSDTAAAASILIDEEPASYFAHEISQDEQLMIAVINQHRASHHLRRLVASARMRKIAQHRFHEPQCPNDNYPGCDVIFDLHRAHICVRHAREYEFFGPNDLSPQGSRASAEGLFNIPQFRHDALLPYWREIGLAIGPSGNGLIIDFLDPC